MNFKEIENKKLVRSYEFTIKNTLLDEKVDEKLEKARLNFQMKGFRKGRTPLIMMKKMFGESTKNEIIQEKSTDKKNNPESKTSKSGWWERKI